MLEVLLPFLYMKQTPKAESDTVSKSSYNSQNSCGFDLACVYAFFKRFVRQYIPNNLHTKFNGRSQILPYLKCCLHLIDLLLGYQDKELLMHLRKRKIVVEMYAAQWVMTLYTRIVEFSLLYEVWEIFLFERDKYMIFYFAVAVMIVHREQILQLNTMEQLLHYLQ